MEYIVKDKNNQWLDFYAVYDNNPISIKEMESMHTTKTIFLFFLILTILCTIGMYFVSDRDKNIAIGYFIYALILTIAISSLFALKELRLYYLKFSVC